MPNNADGFEMAFTGRNTWKANIYRKGELVEVVPVTWTKGWRVDPATKKPLLEVWYKDAVELEARATDRAPFHVALGIAHDYEQLPHSFKSYQGLFEVEATGEILSDISLQTKVIRRVRADADRT